MCGLLTEGREGGIQWEGQGGRNAVGEAGGRWCGWKGYSGRGAGLEVGVELSGAGSTQDSKEIGNGVMCANGVSAPAESYTSFRLVVLCDRPRTSNGTPALSAGGDRPYLISGADDKSVKIWDYQTKACVQTLDGHSHNIAAVCLHPELPIIVTGGWAWQHGAWLELE